MSLISVPDLDSETVISAEVSTVPTTPDGSLSGGTDKFDTESSGNRTTVDDSDSDSSIGARPVKSICCVGAGYVGKCRIFPFCFGPDNTSVLLISDRWSNCCGPRTQEPTHSGYSRRQR